MVKIYNCFFDLIIIQGKEKEMEKAKKQPNASEVPIYKGNSWLKII